MPADSLNPVTLSEQTRAAAAPAQAPVPRGRPPRRGAWIALAALGAVVTIALAVAAVDALTEQHPRRSGTNSIFPGEPAATIKAGQQLCQIARVPETTAAIEVPFADARVPSNVRLAVRDGRGRVVATAASPTPRVGYARYTLPRPLAADVPGKVCFTHDGAGSSTFMGSLGKRGLELDGAIVPGGVTMQFYRAGEESIASLLPEIAQRIGRTRGHLGGAWRAVAIVVLFGVGALLAIRVLAGRARRPWLAVAAVASVNALAWGLLTPPLQVPDEQFHLSYVQDLAEHGRPPDGEPDRFSDELHVIQGGAALGDINFNPLGRGQWSEGAERELDAQLAKDPSPDNPGASVNVKDYPPVYYGALVPVYHATRAAGGSTLDGLTLMRAVGALLAAVTVAAIFLFVLELLPGRPRVAAAAALVCAYQPVFAWISGGVNPDALLIALGAVMFWLFARAFMRELTPGLAAALGLTLAAAMLTKVSGAGLAPGWAAGLALLLWRRTPERRLTSGAAAALAAGAPLLLYVAVNTLVWDRSLLPGGVSAAAQGPGGPQGEAASSFATYLWQYFLPPVGSMTDFFRVGWTPLDLWTPLWVGKFGWYDYQFPNLVNDVAFAAYVVIAVAALAALVPRLPRLGLPVLVFGLLAAGLVVAIARAGYPLRATGNLLFEQARYLMPLLALYGLALALAASLARRPAPGVLAVLVAGSGLHLLWAWELTLQRYYL